MNYSIKDLKHSNTDCVWNICFPADTKFQSVSFSLMVSGIFCNGKAKVNSSQYWQTELKLLGNLKGIYMTAVLITNPSLFRDRTKSERQLSPIVNFPCGIRQVPGGTQLISLPQLLGSPSVMSGSSVALGSCLMFNCLFFFFFFDQGILCFSLSF